MAHAGVVGALEGVEELIHHLQQRGLRRQRRDRQPLRQVEAGDVLHRDVGAAVGLVDLVDADDAGMVDARDRLRLLGQACRERARGARVGGDVQVQRLDRHHALQRGIERLEDGAAHAFADHPGDPVLANLFWRVRHDRHFAHSTGQRLQARLIEEERPRGVVFLSEICRRSSSIGGTPRVARVGVLYAETLRGPGREAVGSIHSLMGSVHVAPRHVIC